LLYIVEIKSYLDITTYMLVIIRLSKTKSVYAQKH